MRNKKSVEDISEDFQACVQPYAFTQYMCFIWKVSAQVPENHFVKYLDPLLK